MEAEVEAVVVAAALRARADSAPPVETDGLVSGGRDLNSDTTFLSEVADGYRRNCRCPVTPFDLWRTRKKL